VIVGDDVALTGTSAVGRRGIAGTLFVHKLCGAAAQRGDHINDVFALAQMIASTVVTIGAGLTMCTVPGRQLEPCKAIPEGHAEYGLGIHGERGLKLTSGCFAFPNCICVSYSAFF
jgi:dihydroxyacetone kinase